MTYRPINSHLHFMLPAVLLPALLMPGSVSGQSIGPSNSERECAEARAPHLAAALAPEARPLVRIAGLQAWVVTQSTGNQTLVMTSDDCLTFEGRIVGPNGEDLSQALLSAAIGTKPRALRPSPVHPTELPPDERVPLGAAAMLAPVRPTTEASPFAQALATSRRYQTDSAQIPNRPWAQATSTVSPVEEIAATLPPPATDAAALLQQVTDVAMWFSVGPHQDGAPTVYMIADPLCPHCANAIQAIAPLVQAEAIDLRIVPVAIVSQASFGTAISLIQSDDPGSTFVAHELASAQSNPSPVQMIDPNEHDPDVVIALARNVLWLRANEIPGVPFWLYVTNEGAQHGMGPWDEAIMSAALPLPMPASRARTPEALR